jgi:C4-type Zn-finger protein
MITYLKDEQYYIDLYDLHTIEECLDTVKMFQNIYQKSLTSKELKDLSEEDKLKDVNLMLHRHLFVIKGKRYEKRQITVQKWLDDDKLKQDKQDFTPAPEGVVCPLCSGSMSFNTSKNLDYSYDSPILRMTFLFKCNKCEKQQWVYDDGEMRVSKPYLCPKCKKEIDIKATRKGKVITWRHECKACGFSKTEVEDLGKHDEGHKKWQEEQDKKREEDIKLLEKYRAEFCLSDKAGKEHVETLEAMEVANVVHDEEMQKYDDPVYERVSKLKRTTIVDLEELLIEPLEKAKYAKLSFEKPEIGQYVIVSFTLQDNDSSRRDRISVSELEKLIMEAVEGTNWRFLSKSVMYRLVYLEGRLKGYEREEDMLKLAGKTEAPQPKPKIDEEKRQKYASNNLVQLGRMTGKYAGIENMRKRRLKKEPEGFFLEISEGPLTCSICGEHYYGNEMWWNLDGTRCKDCWRNIKEGVIPSLKPRYHDKSNWFESWQIKSNHGVHPSSVRKLAKEGLLHSRDLRRKNGAVYYTVYLVSENQEFLKKYPKQKSKIQMSIIDNKGHRVNL